MRAPILRLALLLIVGLGGAACGGEKPAPEPGGQIPSGPPRWRRIPATFDDDASAVAIEVLSSCRVSLVTEGFDAAPKVTATRDVSAGQVLKLEWLAADPKGPPAVPVTAPPAAEAEGRTELHVVTIAVGWDDAGIQLLRAAVWTRPGRGFARVLEVPPPTTPEELAVGRDTELVAILVGDGRPQVLRARRSGDRTVLRMAGAGPEDRARLLRLLLRVEAP